MTGHASDSPPTEKPKYPAIRHRRVREGDDLGDQLTFGQLRVRRLGPPGEQAAGRADAGARRSVAAASRMPEGVGN